MINNPPEYGELLLDQFIESDIRASIEAKHYQPEQTEFLIEDESL